MSNHAQTGSCLCGEVHFEINQELDGVHACHCTMCRKTTGHFLVGTTVNVDNLNFTKEAGVTWYRSSDFAQRAFCKFCGSQLFYKADNSDRLTLMAGLLDQPVETPITRHIFTADKGGYYALDDGAPQFLKMREY